MTDVAWIGPLLRGTRPRVVGALTRYFRDLDRAEEAFQEASLRALKNWPVNGPPRDAAAWLILVGRNVALDDVRRRGKQAPLPADDAISDLGDVDYVVEAIVAGSALIESVEAPRGTRQRPLSASDIRQKFDALTEPALGPNASARLADDVERLETLDAFSLRAVNPRTYSD